nr:T9SS type A sorting domain-containing protein [uncultured Fluviicola sp.]
MVILRVLLVSFLFLFSLESQGQIAFYRVFGGKGYDKAEGVAQLPDSSYIVTGSSSSFEDAPSQAFLLKLDKQGFHVWSKEYGGSEFEEGRRVLFVPNYGYYIVGTSSSNGTGGFDGYVVFTDLSGNKQWEKWYDNGAWERFHDAILLPDTSIVMLGETNANQEQVEDQYFIRIDKDGNEIWSFQSGGVGVDYFNKAVLVTDSTFAVVGTGYLADSLKSKGYIGYYHIDGSLLWDTLTGSNGEYILNDIQLVSNELKCVGQSLKTGKTDTDNYHIFLSVGGSLIVTDDNYMANPSRYVGFVNYTAAPGNKYFVITQGNDPQYSYPNGEDFVINRFAVGFFWDGYGAGYNAVGQDQVNHIIQTNDGYAVLVGYHSDPGFSTGGSSLFIVKLGNDNAFPPSGTPVVFSILTVEELVNNADISIYPNPFTESIQIDASGGLEFIEVLDLTGKQVYTSGSPISSIETASWEKGTYILRCQSNGIWYSRKLMKL